jgi:hypothetical protein
MLLYDGRFFHLDFSTGNCDFAGAIPGGLRKAGGPEFGMHGRETMRKFILMLAGLALLCQAAVAQTASKPAPAATAERKVEPDARVKKLLEARKIEYQVTKAGNFKVDFKLKNGRTQVAFITSATYRCLDVETREIVSPAYRSTSPFSAEIANRLLLDNYEMKLGAWVTEKEPDGYCALFVTKIPADSDDAAFISALRLTLETADAMKKELTGKDEF